MKRRAIFFLVLMLAVVGNAAEYPAWVINFKASPVVLKHLKPGPGFTVENKSGKPISNFRFGCVKGGSQVEFAFTPENIAFESTGPGSKKTFKGWTPVQLVCSRSLSQIGIIEVLFSDNSAWSAPISFQKLFGKDALPAIP